AEREGRRRRRRGGRDRGEGRDDGLPGAEQQGPDAAAAGGAGATEAAGAIADAAGLPASPPEDRTLAEAPPGAPEAGREEREERGERGERGGRGRRRGRGRDREGQADGTAPADGSAPSAFGPAEPAEAPSLVAAVHEAEFAEPGEPAEAPAALIEAAAPPPPEPRTVAPRAAEPALAAPPPAAPPPQPYALPTDALQALAASAGLEWVNSDAGKIHAVQTAMAAEPAPIRVPREIRRPVLADEGPLVLVETRKDLSQMKLPFEGAAPGAPGAAG
ncbi:MAG: ribonuclease E/G, partial [Burkholderiales bacterium]|nr:ribonuclease E/G [Burkholderiales bacterium]